MNKNPLSKIALVYLDSINISPSTLKVYKIIIIRFIEYLQNNGIMHAKVIDVVRYKHHRKELGDSSTYMNIQLSALKGFYHYLSIYYENLNLPKSYVHNIMLNMNKERVKYHIKRHILTPMEAKMLLMSTKNNRKYIWDYRNHAMINLMLTSALRPSEVLHLKISDLYIDKADATLKVRHTYTKEIETIKLTLGTRLAIEAYLKLRTDENPYLFISHKLKSPNLRLSDDFFRYSFKKILETAGLKDKGITPHDLRHTAGNFKLLSGSSTLSTKNFMRHVDLKSTLNYEVHLKRLKDKTEERLENFILKETSHRTFEDYIFYLEH